MTSRPIDSDAMALDAMPPTKDLDVNPDAARFVVGIEPAATVPARIHLGRDRVPPVDYRRTAIAAGALGLGVFAYKAVSALLTRRSRAEPGIAKAAAEPFVLDDGTRTAPAAIRSAPTPGAGLVGTDTGAEFIGEPESSGPDAPFVAASEDDDTAGLLVEVTEIDIVTITPVGDQASDAAEDAPDRSALTPEHVPTDLMGDAPPGEGERAIDAFRPDATAPVPPEMRESLRPATGPATGFAGNRGDFASGLSQADGSK